MDVCIKNMTEHDFITYPRQFKAYKWYKPILVGLLFSLFLLLSNGAVSSLTEAVFKTTVTRKGYDDIDFFTAAGAFANFARIGCCIPSMLLAALIVRDRPVSSYWSSMGGWRWKVFFKVLAAGFVFITIPMGVRLLPAGRSGDVRFTAGGIIMMLIFLPFQCVGEELLYRSFTMQTTGSWVKLPVFGLIAQAVIFAAAHPYNLIGIIHIGLTAVLYGLCCVYTKGIEASSALHILGNLTAITMMGIGFGTLTSEQTIGAALAGLVPEVLSFLFILYAGKKLRWFDDVKKDDVTPFHEKAKRAS